ncbi:hypothetical protein M011DRAFT_480418 [Sporormia fimetaria CBS 119925]|uniref:Elongin-A n=1 Tax=Sporormia fimetaria CBS 119925 TaxID=1340428 RepID=A0A6A6V3L6_9PLEO|nr:hypothetical protein M011DRAFT_480418 [Sporormia fimetaria CBS 119925]
MPAQTLYDLARTRLIASIDLLDDIGDLPYTFMSPILKHILSASQLLTLERNSPQIVGETGELWLKFIQRDIPNWESKPHEPKDPKNWSKVYFKLLREAEREKQAEDAALRAKLRALKEEKEGQKSQILVGAMPTRRPVSSGWGGSGSSTAPSKTGKAALDKLRRGMHDQKLAYGPQALRLPAHVLAQRKGQVTAAPQRMIRTMELERQRKSHAGATSSPASSNPASQESGKEAERKPVRRNETRETDLIRPKPAASPERPRLPPGQTFTAPKIRKVTAVGAAAETPSAKNQGVGAVKKKRETPALFMPQKKRKVG